MITQSLTEHLAIWIENWRNKGFPPDVLESSRKYILDWLGSSIAGSTTDIGKRLIDYAQSQPMGKSRIISLNMCRSAEVAGFVNGCLSHILEMDDLDKGSVTHPGTVIIPAALAVCEREGKNGLDFLSAVVVGYEIGIRVGEAIGKRHYYYFHNTSTCGVFGAAAATAWLLNLNVDQIVWALGNAGTQASGLWEFNSDAAMSKHFHAGRAAANGVLASDLAMRNFTGARKILEGERGLFAATAPDANPQTVIDGLDNFEPKFKINNVSIKPYPSCRHTHATIDAALSLRDQIINQHLNNIEIQIYYAAKDLCDNPIPLTPFAAKFSLQYCVASALLRGHVKLTDFSMASISDPLIEELMPRIHVNVDAQLDDCYPKEWPARVCIKFDNDLIIRKLVNYPKGDPENPMTEEEIIKKFHQLAGSSGFQHLADKLQNWVYNLMELREVKIPFGDNSH